jgi:predicted metal-binding protein
MLTWTQCEFMGGNFNNFSVHHNIREKMGKAYSGNSVVTLSELCNTATELGATSCSIVDGDAIVVDERVRLKCMVPICKNYDFCVVCPPNVMSINEFRTVLSKFSKALLVQISYDVPPWMLERIHAADDLVNLFKDVEYVKGYEQTYKIAKSNLDKIIDRLEAAAFKRGLTYASGFTAGKCTLCDECVGAGNRCRNPYKARPSMEAMGIDVSRTAKNAGLPFEEPAYDKIVLNGLVLLC